MLLTSVHMPTSPVQALAPYVELPPQVILLGLQHLLPSCPACAHGLCDHGAWALTPIVGYSSVWMPFLPHSGSEIRPPANADTFLSLHWGTDCPHWTSYFMDTQLFEFYHFL